MVLERPHHHGFSDRCMLSDRLDRRIVALRFRALLVDGNLRVVVRIHPDLVPESCLA